MLDRKTSSIYIPIQLYRKVDIWGGYHGMAEWDGFKKPIVTSCRERLLSLPSS